MSYLKNLKLKGGFTMSDKKQNVPFSVLSKKAMVAVMAVSMTATGVAGVVSSPVKAEASTTTQLQTVTVKNGSDTYKVDVDRGFMVYQNSQFFQYVEIYEVVLGITDYEVYNDTLYLTYDYSDQYGRMFQGTTSVDLHDSVAPAKPVITLNNSQTGKGGKDYITVNFSADTDHVDVWSMTKDGQSGGGVQYSNDPMEDVEVQEGEIVGFTAYDKSGNASEQVTYKNEINDVGPAPTFAVNSYSQSVNQTEKFQASVTDVAGNDVAVMYRVDGVTGQYGQSVTTLSATGALRIVNGSVDVSQLSEGNHTLYLWAVNENGASSAEVAKTFKVDRTAPNQAGVMVNYDPTGAVVSVTKPSSNTDEFVAWQFEGVSGNMVEPEDEATGTFTFTENGTLTVQSYDLAGNKVVKTYDIKLPVVAPPTKPTIVPSSTVVTGSVTVTVNFDENSAVKEYRLNGGEWTTYTAPVEVKTNYTLVEARAKNVNGDVSQVASYRVSNIDSTAPYLSLRPSTYNLNQTSLYVVATVTDSGTGVQETRYVKGTQDATYFLNGGGTVFYDRNFEVKENGTYSVFAVDKAGNYVLKTITVTNIKATPLESATNAVEKAEKYKSTYYMDNAQTLLDALADSPEKTALQTRLDTVKLELLLSSADSSVLSAENNPTSSYYLNTAKTAVAKLPVGEQKTAYDQRLSVLEYNQLVSSADSAVVTAEKYKTTYYINLAKTAVDKLPEGEVKAGYQARLSTLEYSILLSDAQKAVDSWKKYKTTYYFNKAVEKVNLLPDGADKTQFKAELGL